MSNEERTIRLVPGALTEEQQALVSRPATLSMVRETARGVARRFGALVKVDDLQGEGSLGTVQAARLYDEDQGVAFEIYAWPRARGQMMRKVRQAMETWKFERRLAEAAEEGAYRFAGRVRDESDWLLDTPEDHRRRRSEFADSVLAAASVKLVGEIQRLAEDQSLTPEEQAVARERYARLVEVFGKEVAKLPRPEPKLLELHYWAEQTLKEIAVVLEKSYATVRRLHDTAIGRLARRLRGVEAEAVEVRHVAP
jgi:RNA polymerase sigma factor for flagellar operon FliA